MRRQGVRVRIARLVLQTGTALCDAQRMCGHAVDGKLSKINTTQAKRQHIFRVLDRGCKTKSWEVQAKPSERCVYVSMGAFGERALITAAPVLNAIRYLSPARLALHTSRGSDVAYDDSSQTWWPTLQPHATILLHNPVHVNVSHHRPGIFVLHMLNVELLPHHDPAPTMPSY